MSQVGKTHKQKTTETIKALTELKKYANSKDKKKITEKIKEIKLAQKMYPIRKKFDSFFK